MQSQVNSRMTNGSESEAWWGIRNEKLHNSSYVRLPVFFSSNK